MCLLFHSLLNFHNIYVDLLYQILKYCIMYRLILLFMLSFSFCINNSSFAQVNDTIPADTIIKTFDLNDEQWHVWDSIYEYWLKNEFPRCLKMNKLKLSCPHCESIYLTVNFYIDSKGKLSKYKIVKENVCWSKATTSLKNGMLKYFKSLEFPPPLRNINIQAIIGNGLKC